MRRAVTIFILCVLIWASAGFIKPAFCHAAEVRDVVPRSADGATHLDITVWHNIENSLHYVDTIEVTWGANITSLAIGTQPLAPDGTFAVDYNMGLVSGTPTIVVRARCSVTGYSGAISWTGTIPEPSPIPSPSPSPTPTPTPTPTPSPTPNISPSPSPSPTVTSTPSPTASDSPSPTPSIPELPSILAPSLLIALALIGTLLYKKRQLRFSK